MLRSLNRLLHYFGAVVWVFGAAVCWNIIDDPRWERPRSINRVLSPLGLQDVLCGNLLVVVRRHIISFSTGGYWTNHSVFWIRNLVLLSLVFGLRLSALLVRGSLTRRDRHFVVEVALVAFDGGVGAVLNGVVISRKVVIQGLQRAAYFNCLVQSLAVQRTHRLTGASLSCLNLVVNILGRTLFVGSRIRPFVFVTQDAYDVLGGMRLDSSMHRSAK